MPQNSLEKSGDKAVKIRPEPLYPEPQELSVLNVTERAGFSLTRRMNSGRWKRFWTFCQRHIGSLWIYLATYNLMNVFGIENVEKSDVSRPLLLVANHRSFFDMYTVSSVIFRRTKGRSSCIFLFGQSFFTQVLSVRQFVVVGYRGGQREFNGPVEGHASLSVSSGRSTHFGTARHWKGHLFCPSTGDTGLYRRSGQRSSKADNGKLDRRREGADMVWRTRRPQRLL